VLEQINRVVAAGYKEIALTGVHLGSYGRDLAPASTLIKLLRVAERRTALSGTPVLFRISSLEPMDCSYEVVDLVANSGVFAPHFHLPLQHASNHMLTAMKRPYTFGYYAGLVEQIRQRIPHASIGSDVIVGFPGETGDDFEQLASYLESSPLTHLHVFPYSDRPGTAATSIGGRIAGVDVRERAQRVRAIGRQLSDRFRQAQVGSIRQALTVDDGQTVVTDNYLKLGIAPGRARNEFVRVRVLPSHQAEVVSD